MKRGEEFGKPPPRGPLKPHKPKTPVWRKGGPQPTSYGEKAEERTTEPEAVTPASTEEGLPQTGAGVHEGPPDTQPPPTPPTPRPWRYHWGKWGNLLFWALVIAAAIPLLYSLVSSGFFSSGTSTPPAQEGGGSPFTAQEGGGSQPFTVSNHWVSAVSGKGMRQWDASWSAGHAWSEGDVDLRGGTTGSLTFTVTAVNPNFIEEMGYLIGARIVYNIETWRDNGTTIEFTAKCGEGTQVFKFQLTRTSGGHLTGSVQAPETTETVWFEAPSDWKDPEVPMPSSGWTESTSPAIEGTLDLVPAP